MLQLWFVGLSLDCIIWSNLTEGQNMRCNMYTYWKFTQYFQLHGATSIGRPIDQTSHQPCSPQCCHSTFNNLHTCNNVIVCYHIHRCIIIVAITHTNVVSNEGFSIHKYIYIFIISIKLFQESNQSTCYNLIITNVLYNEYHSS